MQVQDASAGTDTDVRLVSTATRLWRPDKNIHVRCCATHPRLCGGLARQLYNPELPLSPQQLVCTTTCSAIISIAALQQIERIAVFNKGSYQC